MSIQQEKNPREEKPAGSLVFIKAGLVTFLKILLVLVLAWLWWKGRENRPMGQVEKLLRQQK
jgi:hypothetical protein